MMMSSTDPTLEHLPRNLQPSALHNIHIPHATLASQLGADFDPTEPHPFQPFPHTHASIGDAHQLQSTSGFDRPRLQPNGHPHTPPRPPGSENGYAQHGSSQFGVLASGPELPSQPLQHNSLGRLQRDDSFLDSPQTPQKGDGGHFGGLKLIPNPPDLEKWRERLFNVEDTITLTEDE
jgi:glutathione S-transferase